MDRNVESTAKRPKQPKSLSARRAWIEIYDGLIASANFWSLSARRAWIEITCPSITGYFLNTSLSARRAWIEINVIHLSFFHRTVALRKESVDRNRHHNLNLPSSPVALRKESVDRNLYLSSFVLVSLCCRSPQGERG